VIKLPRVGYVHKGIHMVRVGDVYRDWTRDVHIEMITEEEARETEEEDEGDNMDSSGPLGLMEDDN
jgi:hypothetical protein